MIKLLSKETPIGTPVLVRSNNDEPYKLGIFAGYEQFGSWTTKIPVCICDGQTYYVMGIIVERNDELESLLDTLSYKDQWNCLSLNYKRQ